MAVEEGQVIPCHTYYECTVQHNKAKESNKMIVLGFTDFDYEYRYEIASFIADLAKKFKSKAIFLEIDGFEFKSVAKEFDVKAYPTFVLIKGDEVVDMLHSSDKKKIERKIGKHVATSTSIPPPPEHQRLPQNPVNFEEMAAQVGKVIRCHTYGEWTVQLNKAKGANKMIVIEFTASNCGQCQELSPFIADLAKKLKSKIIFFEVDCFELKRVAKEFDVMAYPTFVFMLCNGIQEKLLHSSDKKKIEGTINILEKLRMSLLKYRD